MSISKHLVLASLISCLVAACASPQPASDPEVVDESPPSEKQPFEVDTTGWSDDRRAVEDAFIAWIQWGESLDEAMAQGVTQLTHAAVNKGEGQLAIEMRLQPYLSNADDPEAMGWASLRSAQMYLNFACELDAVALPQGLTEEQKIEYELSIADLVDPLIDRTTSLLESISEQSVAPWNEQAAFILSELDPRTDESCEATAEFWRPTTGPTQEDRLADAADACRAGNLAGCEHVLRFASEDESGEFLEQSCRLDAGHCRRAAMHFIESDDHALIEELLRIGCEGQYSASCQLQAAYVRPDARNTYQTRCAEGDYLGCVHVVKSAEATAPSGLHDFCIDSERTLADRQNAQTTCAAEGDPLACMALGASVFYESYEAENDADELATLLADETQFTEDERRVGFALIGRASSGPRGLGEISEATAKIRLAEYEADCSTENLRPCVWTGELLERLDRDPTPFYEMACEADEALGCLRMGQYIDDPQRALELFEIACNDGVYDGSGCRERAEALQETQQGSEHHQEIVTLLRKNCTSDSPSTCNDLARYFESRGDNLSDRTCALYYNAQACTMESTERCRFILP